MVYGDNPTQRAERGLVARRARAAATCKYDNPSHGAPHKMNSEIFWETKKPFAEKYGAKFANFGGPAPADPAGAAGGVRGQPARP